MTFEGLLKIIGNILIEEFEVRELITGQDFFYFLRNNLPDLNEETGGWRINDLKNKNITSPLK
jgi:hypothetical protein